jgi:hypothetical protein
MSRAIRAENILARFAREANIGYDAQIAMENAIDTFPDTRRALRGWPDSASGASVVPKSKQSITIQCPSGITTGTYDIHIFNMPNTEPNTSSGGYSVANRSINVSGSNVNGFTLGASNGAPTLSGIVAVACQTGTPLSLSATPSSTYTVQTMTTPAQYTSDVTRMIASGIEIHNPTASLYKQGTITCYRQPVNSSRYASTSMVVSQISGQNTITGAASFLAVPSPPPTTSAALALADSTQWNAEQGAYIMHAFHTNDIPTNATSFVQPIIYTGSPNDTSVLVPAPAQLFQSGTPSASTPLGFQARFWTETDMSGCILSGLSLQSTILVNWNAIYETFPTGNDILLENLASPSPPLDIRGLECLSILHHELPIAVEVSRNGIGDWISGVANTLRSTLSPTITMLQKAAPAMAMMPHPGLKAAGMGLMMSSSPQQQQKQIAAIKQQQKSEKELKALFHTPDSATAAANRTKVARGNTHAQLTPSAGPTPSKST